MARKSVKRKPVRKTKSQRMSFDEMHMGPEPSEDYFKDNNIGAYFNWYNYMYEFGGRIYYRQPLNHEYHL